MYKPKESEQAAQNSQASNTKFIAAVPNSGAPSSAGALIDFGGIVVSKKEEGPKKDLDSEQHPSTDVRHMFRGSF